MNIRAQFPDQDDDAVFGIILEDIEGFSHPYTDNAANLDDGFDWSSSIRAAPVSQLRLRGSDDELNIKQATIAIAYINLHIQGVLRLSGGNRNCLLRCNSDGPTDVVLFHRQSSGYRKFSQVS